MQINNYSNILKNMGFNEVYNIESTLINKISNICITIPSELQNFDFIN